MSLARAEWRRLFARRFTRILLVVIVGILGLVAAGEAASYRRTTEADHVAARQQVIAANQSLAHEAAECNAAQNNPNADPNGPFAPHNLPPGMTCDTIFSADQVRESWFLPQRWVLADQAGTMLIVFAAMLALFGFAVGASYIGAEWSSGGIMNLLLWRPRRIPLLAAKLGTLLAGVLAAGIAVLVLWVGMLSAVAATRGYFGTFTTGHLQSLALAGTRGLALGMTAAAIGFAVATIGRNTVTALAIALGYLLVVEGAGHLVLLNLHRVAEPDRYFLSSYVYGWLNNGHKYTYQSSCVPQPDGSLACSSITWTLTVWHAAEVLGVIAAVVLAWAFLAFRRRDMV